MTYQRLALWSALRRLRRPGFYLLVLAALAAALVFRWTEEEAAPPVQVGVALPSVGGEALWEALEARENRAVRFIPADADTIRAQVASSRWDCGLLFPEDFARRLEELDLEACVTLVTGPGSAAYPLVRETAAAVLAALASPRIAESYLRETGMNDVPLGMEGPEAPRVDLTLEALDGQPLSQQTLADAGRERMLLGMTAAALLVWTLFAAMDLGRWKETPAARRLLPCVGMTALLLPRLLAQVLAALFAALLALGTAEPAAFWMLPPYLAALSGLAMLLAESRRVWKVLPAVIPFAASASLILSPVFLDVTLLYPALGPVCRCLPVTLYLSGCGGAPGGAFGLLLTAAALWTLALLRGRCGRWRCSGGAGAVRGKRGISQHT